MRHTFYNILLLLTVPLTLMPIILGAADALEAQRKEHYYRMRREHLRSLAKDRKRKAERLQRLQAQNGNRKFEIKDVPRFTMIRNDR